MMTIKEFASLCQCNTQTLRYYDKIDLLKPSKVDPWSSCRYYEEAQALDFVKIKNLQAALIWAAMWRKAAMSRITLRYCTRKTESDLHFDYPFISAYSVL